MASAFHRDSGGTVTVIVALAATTLMGLVGGAIDYARLVSARSHIQQATDAGVMAGGNALKLVVSNTASVIGLTTQTIQEEIKDSAKNPVTIQVGVASDKTSVTAVVEQTIHLTFGPFVGLQANAIARGWTVKGIEVESEGDINITSVWGTGDLSDKPVGLTTVRLKVHLDVEGASAAELDELVAHAGQWSPVLNTVKNPVSVTLARA